MDIVVWDQYLTQGFRNADLKKCDVPFEKDKLFHLAKTAGPIMELLPVIADQDAERRSSLLQDAILARTSIGSPHKRYCTWHIKSCYFNGPSHPDSIRLAHISNYLIDAPKSGLILNSKVLREDAHRWDPYDMPDYYQWMNNQSYLTGKRVSPDHGRRKHLHRKRHLKVYPIDRIKVKMEDFINGLCNRMERLHMRKSNHKDMVTCLDADLLGPWLRFCQELDQNPSLLQDFQTIENFVLSILQDYTELQSVFNPPADINPSSSSRHFTSKEVSTKDGCKGSQSSSGTFTESMEKESEIFEALSIKFHEGLSVQDIEFPEVTGDHFQNLETLKISCAYYLSTQNEKNTKDTNQIFPNFVWDIAFEGVCRIKLAVKSIKNTEETRQLPVDTNATS